MFLLITSVQSFSQQKLEKLTVEKIMRDPQWIGTSPSNVQWSQDGQYLYFRWNPDNDQADSLYYISLANKIPVKASTQETQNNSTTGNFVYNQARTAYTYSRDGATVYARLYKPANPHPNKPAVLFVHGEVIYRMCINGGTVISGNICSTICWPIMVTMYWILIIVAALVMDVTGEQASIAILNEPFNDSIAYHKSSPIYYAGGLIGHLLMCHGMVDVNVHFQDIVKVSQRLIELGKDNRELAVYLMEDHGFVESGSWTDEYKRVFKLFEEVLKKP